MASPGTTGSSEPAPHPEDRPEPPPVSAAAHSPPASTKLAVAGLALGALGVVYGDIGTSPLYAIKECFAPHRGHVLAANPANVLGILSLVFWALVLVVGVKYLGFVMRADNHGEGGILALLALALPERGSKEHRSKLGQAFCVAVALFGAALLGADGTITPAISVLSAVEGLGTATHALDRFILPITVVILLIVFGMQRFGTGDIGMVFGPAMLVWFGCIAALGVYWIAQYPGVLAAVSPHHAIMFFVHNRIVGVVVLGAVVLCITGGEALYADMGHFGRKPIRLAWFAAVFPALLLNYFGQGARILAADFDPLVLRNPFYALAPGWFLYPLVAIATVAAVIASQAMISGAFSLAQQAVQMGYSPRLTIVHTSSEERGQIYVPEINALLMVVCIGLVLTLQSSNRLAAAYGVAVVGAMTITSLLLFVVMRRRWQWPLPVVVMLVCLFLLVDLTFLWAVMQKIADGGWFPLAVGFLAYEVMSTWKRGRTALGKWLAESSLSLTRFLESFARQTEVCRVKGTAVFMTSNPRGTPVVMMHHLKHNKVMHERVILLCVTSSDEIPEIPADQRVEIKELGQGFYQVFAHYGFVQTPNVPEIFRRCEKKGLEVNVREASFYLGRETLIITKRKGMMRWRKMLFAFLSRNALSATAYFGIPPNRVVELGAQVEL